MDPREILGGGWDRACFYGGGPEVRGGFDPSQAASGARHAGGAMGVTCFLCDETQDITSPCSVP